MKDARTIIRKALITEKGTALRELRNQYHFEVDPEANKIEIKRAVETLFSVKVKSVRTQQHQGKARRQGRYAGRRNDYLSSYADNKYHFDPIFNIQWNPYPEGEERTRINAAFDELFAAIRR